ncbi:MAG TPA: ABC transporter, partial [Desulfovibrio sp.]|nr:ABC transporter [Desulfovibrio sp.]
MALVSAALQDFYVTSESGATALEVVLAGFFDEPLLYEEPDPELRQRALAALKDLDAMDLAGRPMRTLSQGQARRVLLVRALVTEPDILLLDEFLDGLDAASRAATLELLERAGERATLLCAAHRVEDLPGCVQRALVLDQGRVRDQGPAAEV